MGIMSFVLTYLLEAKEETYHCAQPEIHQYHLCPMLFLLPPPHITPSRDLSCDSVGL